MTKKESKALESLQDDLTRARAEESTYGIANTPAITTSWGCATCGAKLTVDCLSIGSGRWAHAVWCNVCDKRMEHLEDARPTTTDAVAQKYFGE